MAKERPVLNVQLPSRGIFYDGKIPDGMVDIHPMRFTEETMLAGMTGSPIEKMNALLRSCVKTDFDVSKLLSVDRMYLIVQIKVFTYGEFAKVMITCPDPDCRNKFQFQVDQTKFKVTTAPEGAVEPFDVILPVSGDVISLRFLRGEDEKIIYRLAEAAKKKGGNSAVQLLQSQLLLSIVSINGNDQMSDMDKIDWASDLSMKDSDYLSDKQNNSDDFGINLTFVAECPKCTLEETHQLPAENIFRN